jgi:hypothetical protein
MDKIKDIIVLPTDNLVITDYHCNLFLYNSNFVRLKTLSGLDEKNRFIPNGLTTSPHHLFISDSRNNRILISDFEINLHNFFNLFGTTNDHIGKPQGLLWHAGNLYICDNHNMKLKIFDENFKLANSVHFDFRPDKIQISATTAFIIDSTVIERFNLRIYSLHNWKLLQKHDNTNSLCRIDSNYYGIRLNSILICFNPSGTSVHQMDIGAIINDIYPDIEIKGILMLKKSLIFYSTDRRCIKFNLK